MARAKSRTKRDSLRFKAKGYILHFKTAWEDGEASVDNISAGGCLFESVSLDLSPGEKILISVEALLEDNITPLEVSGVVLRCDKGKVAVKFMQLSEEKKRVLVKFLAHTLRQREQPRSE